jgi:hypothetical protein
MLSRHDGAAAASAGCPPADRALHSPIRTRPLQGAINAIKPRRGDNDVKTNRKGGVKADIHNIAGAIVLKSPQPGVVTKPMDEDGGRPSDPCADRLGRVPVPALPVVNQIVGHPEFSLQVPGDLLLGVEMLSLSRNRSRMY